MTSLIIEHLIVREERRYGRSLDHVRRLAAHSRAGFFKLLLLAPLGAHRRHLSKTNFHVARIAAIRSETCGACLDMAVTTARQDGVDERIVAAVASGQLEALPSDQREIAGFARDVIGGSLTNERQQALALRLGEPTLMELALAIALARFFPTLKRALGESATCQWSVPQPVSRSDDSVTGLRRRIEMQGFCGLTDPDLRALRPWLKLAPALCLLWVGAALIGQSPILLGSLIPFALAGAVLPWHPFDILYQRVIRKWTGGPAIPRYRSPRRFACLVASGWLALTTGLWLAGQSGVANLLGGLFVATAAMPVLFDFCVPSFLLTKLRLGPSCGLSPSVADDVGTGSTEHCPSGGRSTPAPAMAGSSMSSGS